MVTPAPSPRDSVSTAESPSTQACSAQVQQELAALRGRVVALEAAALLAGRPAMGTATTQAQGERPGGAEGRVWAAGWVAAAPPTAEARRVLPHAVGPQAQAAAAAPPAAAAQPAAAAAAAPAAAAPQACAAAVRTCPLAVLGPPGGGGTPLLPRAATRAWSPAWAPTGGVLVGAAVMPGGNRPTGTAAQQAAGSAAAAAPVGPVVIRRTTASAGPTLYSAAAAPQHRPTWAMSLPAGPGGLQKAIL